MTVGILALQGDYNQHKRVLDILGTNNIYVRHKQDIQLCDALIIPGGESTTISKQIDNNNLRKPIIEFSKNNIVFGGVGVFPTMLENFGVFEYGQHHSPDFPRRKSLKNSKARFARHAF